MMGKVQSPKTMSFETSLLGLKGKIITLCKANNPSIVIAYFSAIMLIEVIINKLPLCEAYLLSAITGRTKLNLGW